MPDRWQRDLLASPSMRILLNCCRQSGKSTMASIIALHRALYYPGSLVLCLAPSLRQSRELYVKLAGHYQDLGRPVPPTAERRLSLELENGSRVLTLPGTERTVRGFSKVSLIVADEASRVPDELYYAVRPMLAVSGGSLLMLSTPWGAEAYSGKSGPRARAGSAMRYPRRSVLGSRMSSWKRRGVGCRTGSIARSTSAALKRPRTRYSAMT